MAVDGPETSRGKRWLDMMRNLERMGLVKLRLSEGDDRFKSMYYAYITDEGAKVVGK